MKQSKEICRLLKQVPLMVALLAAFVFTASSGLKPFLQQELRQRQHVQHDADDQKDERSQAFFDYGCNALAPVAQLAFLHQVFIEAPPPAITQVKEQAGQLPPLRVDPFLKTLFRLIISPNAP